MGVTKEAKNLICKNGPHEQVLVQLPQVQLRCPLVKASISSDVLEAQNNY